MMPIHDPNGLRTLERELRESAERARQLAAARTNGAKAQEDAAARLAEIAELPRYHLEEVCVDCELDLEREQPA